MIFCELLDREIKKSHCGPKSHPKCKSCKKGRTGVSELELLQDATIKELLAFFDGSKATRESKDAKYAANLAVRSLAAIGRVKGTDRAQDAMRLMVIKHISEDKKEFKKYLAVSMPGLSPARQIKA